MNHSRPFAIHAGWATDSPVPPATTIGSLNDGSPSTSTRSATHRRVESHGIEGWSHVIHASRTPTASSRGHETKSLPSNRTVGSPPSTGTATEPVHRLVTVGGMFCLSGMHLGHADHEPTVG